MRFPSLEAQYTISNWAYDAPGGNTAAGIEIPAVAGYRIIVRQIHLSVRGGINWTNVQALTVTHNAAVVWNVTIPKSEGVHTFDFPWGLYTATENANSVFVNTTQPDSAPTDTQLKMNVCWEYV